MAKIPGRKNPSNSEFEGMLEVFEKQMRDLEILYEKYFNGSDRRPPINERRQIARLSREIDQAYITNTALKFRARNLQNRLVTLQNYWNRVMRQIEDGTYIRDKQKANRRQARLDRVAEQEEQQQVYELDESLGGFSFDDLAAELADTFDAIKSTSSDVEKRMEGSDRPSAPIGGAPPSTAGTRSVASPPQFGENFEMPMGRRQEVAKKTPPRSPVPGSVSPPVQNTIEAQERAVYERYIQARRECNQSTDISFDRLAESMRSQRSSIQQKKGVQNVDFDVVIKNGQAFLKPTSKDS